MSTPTPSPIASITPCADPDGSTDPSRRWRRWAAGTLAALPLAASAAAFVGASWPGEAHAGRGGIIVINTGQDVMHIMTIDQAGRDKLGAGTDIGELHVSVVYDLFGIFWLDVARWNARFAICEEQGDGPGCDFFTPDEIAEMTGIAAADVKIPITFYMPPGGIILGLALLIGGPLYLLSTMRQSKSE